MSEPEEKQIFVKHLPLQPRCEMAHLFTTADTVMSGSHLWSTPPDIGRRGREENRSELGRENPNNNSPLARVANVPSRAGTVPSVDAGSSKTRWLVLLLFSMKNVGTYPSSGKLKSPKEKLRTLSAS